jgi:CheY-like chemotaxis protein
MKHVLIIEDEMLIALHLESLIADIEGTTVDLAATDSEAVEIAGVRPPSLILSDVRLAEGTGPAAVKSIHEMLGPVPVIYVTGNPEQAERNAPVILKPIRDNLLVATASTMVSASAATGMAPV